MNRLVSKTTGWLVILVGSIGLFSFITLLLFFVSLFQNISSLSFMGALNDSLNALAGILAAVLASALHPALRQLAPRSSPFLLISVWAGAAAIMFGSWLIQTGRSDVELSSYYFFFGNGLIGIWLWMLNGLARQQLIWRGNLMIRSITTDGRQMMAAVHTAESLKVHVEKRLVIEYAGNVPSISRTTCRTVFV